MNNLKSFFVFLFTSVLNLEWYVYAIAGMILYSFANLIWKYLSSSYSSSVTSLAESLAIPALAAVIVFFVLMFMLRSSISINATFVLLVFTVVVLSLLGIGLFFYSLQFGKVALVTAVMSLSTIVVAFLSFVFFGDRFSWTELTALGLAVLSVIVLIFA
jgi:drug/metabolite transporter (DMT)-like permease